MLKRAPFTSPGGSKQTHPSNEKVWMLTPVPFDNFRSNVSSPDNDRDVHHIYLCRCDQRETIIIPSMHTHIDKSQWIERNDSSHNSSLAFVDRQNAVCSWKPSPPPPPPLSCHSITATAKKIISLGPYLPPPRFLSMCYFLPSSPQ